MSKKYTRNDIVIRKDAIDEHDTGEVVEQQGDRTKVYWYHMCRVVWIETSKIMRYAEWKQESEDVA